MATYDFLLTAYRGKYLHEAISSILAQTYAQFKLIVVDDASPDDLESIVKGFDDSRISFIRHQVNMGGNDLIAHWNNCLKYTQADYVILASDDDIYHTDYLQQMHKLTKEYPTADVLHARAEFVDESMKPYVVSPPLKPYLSAAEYAYVYANEWIISSLQNHMFRREALCRMGGFVNFPLAWHSDDATVLALSAHGVAYSEDILFTFRNSGENISSKKDDCRALTKKIEAREGFYNWLETKYVPKLKAITAGDAYSQLLISGISEKLSNKLRHLTFSMLHKADIRTLWQARKAFASLGFMSEKEYRRYLRHKLWMDWRFALNIFKWPSYLYKRLTRK